MSFEKQFEKTLDELWKRRTSKIRSLVIHAGRGKRARFDRDIREKLLGDLLALSTQILLKRKDIQDKFEKGFGETRYHKIRGRGYLNRYRNIYEWAKTEFPRDSLLYIFWKKRTCLYVGKAPSYLRLRAYKKSKYLKEATRIQIRLVPSKSELARQECLAIHYYNPKDNKNKPPKQPWGKSCPICSSHDTIRREILALFTMKKRKKRKR